MASAGVVLGLMPIILANQGPTLAESSILSMERPLLSILLAIGGPSIYPARPFAYYDPLEAINQAPAGFTNSPDGHLTYFAVSALQYLISLAAAANVIAVSLELGLKTVVVWKKRNPYLPLIWVLLPVVLHVGAAIRLHLFVANAASRRQHRLLNVVKQNERLKPDQRVPHSRRYSLRYLLSKTISLYHLFAKIVDGEICPCRFRTTSKLPPLSETKEIDEPYLSYVLALCLPLLSLGHLVVGIMIFSSLLFIGVGDTGSIVLRYCVSALAVQVIRNLEATGYQVALQKAHHV
ncbi:hypothetical protein MMC13_008077 [Lambiella insularis]|nr:hypothetical protein [Lambiella insularis]